MTGRKFGAMGAVVAASLLASAGSAWATITVDGVTFGEGTVFKATQIWENTVVNPGDVLTGIGIVAQITGGDCAGLCWQSGNNGTELTFTFSYTLEKVTLVGNDAVAWFSGGDITFYADDSPNFTYGNGLNQAADIASATDGDQWLNLFGATTGTVCAALDACDSGAGTVISLLSNFSVAGGDLAVVLNGSGSGFLDVVAGPGSANAFFNVNSQPSGQDILLTSSFAKSLDSENFAIEGTANLRTLPRAVPEPTTLALLGAGLFGLVWARRRRSSRA